jgi:hypothetical protein
LKECRTSSANNKDLWEHVANQRASYEPNKTRLSVITISAEDRQTLWSLPTMAHTTRFGHRKNNEHLVATPFIAAWCQLLPPIRVNTTPTTRLHVCHGNGGVEGKTASVSQRLQVERV